MHGVAKPCRIRLFCRHETFCRTRGTGPLVALPMARAQQSPDDQYIAIYNLMQQADTLKATSQPRQALAGYTQALAGLQKFQKIFPDWNSEIVTYRLNYLTDKINGLAAQLPPLPQNGPPPATNAVPAGASAADLAAQLSALRAQVQGLQRTTRRFRPSSRKPCARSRRRWTRRNWPGAGAVLALMKENDLLRASLTPVATNVAAPGELSKARQALADANQKLARKPLAPTSWRRKTKLCSRPPASTRWKRPRWRNVCISGKLRRRPRRRKPATR